MHDQFWQHRRVLVTGHTGFKGSWLCSVLQRFGAKVSGLALPPSTTPSLFNLLRLGEHVDSSFIDIRSAEEVRNAVRRAEPEIVLHLAAQPLVRASYANPLETFQTNVLGTVNILEALRESDSVQAVVIVTTDKCYRNDEDGRSFKEDDPLGGNDPYSTSKAAAELVAHSYRVSFGVAGGNIATARAGNVIGGGDWSEDRLVPDIIRAAEAGREVLLRYPLASRPWQHVLDSVSGYLTLAEYMVENGGDAGAWNFGPELDQAMNVAQLAEAVLVALNRPASWINENGAQPHEAKTLRLDSTKARTLLDWRSRLNAEATVNWTAQWYKAWQNDIDARSITAEQIEEYLAL